MSAKCSSVKRIQKEISEIQSDHSEFYFAAPLEDNLFEWHFTIAGPQETEFAGGLYHGQILLPPEYPFRPPWVVFKTPNGRFQLNQKICLSVTAYHPEEWNPSWGIRTVLMGIISHFPTEDKSSIGYLGYSKEERAKLAKESVDFVCPVCKVPNHSLVKRPFDFQNEEKEFKTEILPKENSKKEKLKTIERNVAAENENSSQQPHQRKDSSVGIIFLVVSFVVILIAVFVSINKAINS